MVQELVSVRHERSKKDFPKLTIEDDEYVETFISRVSVSYVLLWIGILFGVAILMLVCSLVSLNVPTIDELGQSALIFFAGIISVVLLIFGLVETFVFRHNKMYVTNKRVVQDTMISPLATSHNVIDLSSIEDVSFKQGGVMQKLFNYGTLRLSTVGDETTYTFPYANNDPEQLALIVKLVNDDREKNDSNKD